MRLQTKLSLTLLPLMALTILVLGAWFYQQARQEKYDDVYTILELLMHDYVRDHVLPYYQLQQDTGAQTQPPFQHEAQVLLEENLRKPLGVDLSIFSGDGQLLVSQASLIASDWTGIIQQVRRQALQQDDTSQHGHIGESLYVARYFPPWDWVVILTEDEAQIAAALAPVRIAVLGATFFCALLAALLIWLLFRRFLLRPIRILQHAADSIAARQPVTSIPIHSDDELGALARDMEASSQAIVGYVEQRKGVEAELMIRNRALEASVNGVIVCDALHADHPIVYVNPAFERLTGYSAQECVGHNCRFLQGNDYDQKAREQIRTALAAQQPVSVELRNYRKDGTLFWNELRIAPVRDDTGVVTHFIGIQSDITDRKQTEQALQESHRQLEQRVQERTAELASANQRLRQENTERQRAEQLLRSLLKAAPDATVIVDRGGAIQFANDQTEAVFGYTQEELIGQRVEQLIPERFAEKHRYQHKAYFDKPRFRFMGSDLSLYGRKKSGLEFPIEVSLSPIETIDGLRVAAAVRDVTERKQTESALRQAKREAERADQAKTRFLAAASHDLRQPLQTISLLSGALSLKLTEPDLRAIVEKQQAAIQTMQKLLAALLDISRLEAGVIQPDISVFPVAELLQRLRDGFIVAAEKQDLALRIAPCSCQIRSDRTLLGQVLENLLSNAIKYTQQGKVLVGCRRHGKHLRIEVWDTGPGIPAEQKEAVFEEFYQLDNPTRNRNKGFGLGLAIVQRLSHLLKHPVEMHSTPGKGSCFSIQLPLARARLDASTDVDAHTVPELPLQAQARLILLIEDDTSVLQATQLLLETSGYRVSPVSDSEQALAALNTAMPALIISDYRLPGPWNGLELIAQIRQTAGKHLPAILITGDTSTQKLRLAEANNCRVLHKPIDPQDLQTLIQKMLT